MARKNKVEARPSGRTVLLVDDNDEYLQAARRVIERDGHHVIAVPSGPAALAILRERDVDLVLVDYLMPGMNGEELVREMRAFRPTTQVILQTGYATEHPPRELLRRLDIQGFHDKSDGPEKLAVWVDVGLKAAYTTQLLADSRAGLRYVLEATPALHRIQPLDDLLQGILLQMQGLIGASNSFLASLELQGGTGHADGFLAIRQEDEDLCLRAVTGRFRATASIEDSLDSEQVRQLRAALRSRSDVRIEGVTVAPLRIAQHTIGLLYLDRAIREEWQRELVEVFANQAAVAIHNVSLYEMAALDGLTGVATRRFFGSTLARELRGASRTGAPLGLLLLDVDDMKGVNDGFGHVAGDKALAAIGACLRRAIRQSDVAGRIGGDELAVILPATDAPGVAIVAERIRRALDGLTIEHEGETVPIGVSVGGAALAGERPFAAGIEISQIPQVLADATRHLMEAADAAMYARKKSRDTTVATLPWPRSDAPATV